MRIETLTVPKHPTGRWQPREMAAITTLVVHHTGAREQIADTASYLRAASRWFVRKYAWPGIPYHFAVGQDGRVYLLNDCGQITYHAGRREANIASVAVVLAGNFTRSDPAGPQLQAAAELCRILRREACPGVGSIVPHSAIVPTACPGRWDRWGHLLRLPAAQAGAGPPSKGGST